MGKDKKGKRDRKHKKYDHDRRAGEDHKKSKEKHKVRELDESHESAESEAEENKALEGCKESGRSEGRRRRDPEEESRQQERKRSHDTESAFEEKDVVKSKKNRKRSKSREADESRTPGNKGLSAHSRGHQELFRRAKSYILSDPVRLLLILEKEPLGLEGTATLECVCGKIEIMGYHLTPKDGPIKVYSQRKSAHVTLKQVRDKETSHQTNIKKLKEYLRKEEPGLLDSFISTVTKSSAVVAVSALSDLARDYVTSISLYEGLFCDSYYSEDVFRDLGCRIIERVDSYKSLSYNHYDDIAHNWQEDIVSGKSPTIVVCGGKDVGKSTFSRYLINSLLNRCPQVAYLECDPGQTEFTPPCCVSLHLVSQPLLGPPMTHQRQAYSQVFIGTASPGADPALYLRCLQHVYEQYQAVPSKPPLVVNTMGWVKGIGLSLLIDTLRMVKPSIVLQIQHTTVKAKNLPRMTPDYVHSTPGWSDTETDQQESQSVYPYKLLTVDSPVNSDSGMLHVFGARDYRTMASLAYFSQLFQGKQSVVSINELQPYRLPWEKTSVFVCHEEVPDNHIMYALNASMVALCSTSTHQTELIENDRVEDKLPRLLKATPVCECIGFGIIRGIDPIEKLFYILTPVAPHRLPEINCILQGAQDFPLHLLQQNCNTRPYIDKSTAVQGGTSIKRRRHIRRRSRSPYKSPQGPS